MPYVRRGGASHAVIRYARRVRGMGQDPAIDPNTGFEVGTFDPSFSWFTPSLPDVSALPTVQGAPSSSFNVGSALSQLALGGEKIAGAILQKPGQFTQTVFDPRTGTYSTVTSNAVPGAIPGGGIPYLGGQASLSSFLPIALLGGGLLLAVSLFRGGR